MNVLLVADHRLARDAALAALEADERVDRVTVANRRLVPVPSVQPDLVLLEQSVDALSVADLDGVLEACPDACVVTLALVAGDRYAWVGVRRTTGWYQVHATGEGPLRTLVTRIERDRRHSLIA